jgi:hypothetical protein
MPIECNEKQFNYSVNEYDNCRLVTSVGLLCSFTDIYLIYVYTTFRELALIPSTAHWLSLYREI